MKIYDLAIIYLFGVTGMWKALPVGFLLKTHPFFIALMTSLGALTNVFLMYFFGKNLQKFVMRFYSEKRKQRKKNRGRKILEKYGCPGLGLFGTLFFGQPLVMILGMILVKDKKKFVFWVSIGTVIWSIALTALGYTALNFLKK
ncbi:MAG: small multi-drug export protein [Bacteroidota bacterium]|nr:small multi-drug export protein [Bacteroidota bacterium]